MLLFRLLVPWGLSPPKCAFNSVGRMLVSKTSRRGFKSFSARTKWFKSTHNFNINFKHNQYGKA